MNKCSRIKSIAVIALGILVLRSFGCTTAVAITQTEDLNQFKGKEITVKTIHGQTYILETWSLDKSKNIVGTGNQVPLSAENGARYEGYSGTLLAAEISRVELRKFDCGTTMLLVIPVAVVVTWVIYAASNLGPSGPL